MELMQSLSLEPSIAHLTDGSMTRPADHQHQGLQNLSKPHIDSFNVAMEQNALDRTVMDINEEFVSPADSSKRIKLQICGIAVSKPVTNYGRKSERMNKDCRLLYPRECRMSGSSYCGNISVKLCCMVNNEPSLIDYKLGSVPIMVKSDLCNINGLPPEKLVSLGEEAEEFGGYFIVNGIERIARLLIQQRRNLPMAVKRATWAGKKKNYTEYGVSIRCVDREQNISTNIAHYLSTGEVELSVRISPQMFYLPVMLVLMVLSEKPPSKIAKMLASNHENYIENNTRNMMSILATKTKIFTRDDALEYLGRHFSLKFQGRTNKEVARHLIDKFICIHVKRHEDKFNVLIEMTRKLFRFANNECCAENPDWLSFQEVLTPGHLYQLVLKDTLGFWLHRVKLQMASQMKVEQTANDVQELFLKVVNKSGEITKDMLRWISTGSLPPRTDLGLTQTNGLTVVAEKLNFMRYFSHFRSVHRGSYFQELKSTEVRKLRPETWGFLCPTHTPDGGPCGLLVHMSSMCRVVTELVFTHPIEKMILSMGVIAYHDTLAQPQSFYHLVYLDGKVIGWVSDNGVQELVDSLRHCKIHSLHHFPSNMEICLVPKRRVAAQYPGVYIFTSPGRLIRPVTNLKHDKIELIGTFEQSYLQIAVTQKDIEKDKSFHYCELSQLSIMSELAAMTPFSDHNHSCRNMYQCQMAKQTMGTPVHAWPCRADNKLYRLLSPQAPLVKTPMYDHMKCDDYPIGTNAVVAVMSYTGFDMEDAIAINSASYNRGFGEGAIIKSEVVNLKDIAGDRSTKVTLVFESKSTDPKVNRNIDADGLPFPGIFLEQNDPMYSYYNFQTSEYKVVSYHGIECAYVQQVVLTFNSEDDPTKACQKAIITLRIPRKPTIGDKFSSRHGQKGVCSVLYPAEDMPFTLTGMTPDIIFNPHGFPSRMTVGMMIELMAGKSAAELGICHNASPFTYANGDEDDDCDAKTAVEVFQDYLIKAGFNYNGTDIMICGTNGRPLTTYIFTGIVYYQRLRHMVYDKWQVRMTGSVSNTTMQPLGGRKRQGGVRFGEMERDALIAHGASMMLHDRLFNCSDGMTMQACVQCGSLISPIYGLSPPESINQSPHWRCLTCDREDTIVNISTPYIFKYFVSQLASLNIKTLLKIGQE